jgi:hypothetical protein
LISKPYKANIIHYRFITAFPRGHDGTPQK